MKVGPIALNPNKREKLATYSHGEKLPNRQEHLYLFFSLKHKNLITLN